MDILSEVGRYYELEAFSALDKTSMYEVVTPAHRFKSLVSELSGGEVCLVTTARDSFDPDLAASLVRFLGRHDLNAALRRPITVYEGFRQSGYGFDSAATINHQVNTLFKAQNAVLHRCTLLGFPMFRCEFSGDEDASIVELLRQRFVGTIDWRRAPAPKVLMRYTNTKTRSRSVGTKLGLAEERDLMLELANQWEAEGSYIEVKNYRYEYCKIVSVGRGYVLSEMPGQTLEQDAAVRWLKEFLTIGLASTCGR